MGVSSYSLLGHVSMSGAGVPSMDYGLAATSCVPADSTTAIATLTLLEGLVGRVAQLGLAVS